MSNDSVVRDLGIPEVIPIKADYTQNYIPQSFGQICNGNPALESFLNDDKELIFSSDSFNFKSFFTSPVNSESINQTSAGFDNSKDVTTNRSRRKSFSIFRFNGKPSSISTQRRLIPVNSAPLLRSSHKTLQLSSDNLNSVEPLGYSLIKNPMENNFESSTKNETDFDSAGLIKAKQYIQKIFTTVPSKLFSKGHRSILANNKYDESSINANSFDSLFEFDDPFLDNKSSNVTSFKLKSDFSRYPTSFSGNISQPSGVENDPDSGTVNSNYLLDLNLNQIVNRGSKENTTWSDSKSIKNAYLKQDTKRIRYPTPVLNKSNSFTNKPSLNHDIFDTQDKAVEKEKRSSSEFLMNKGSALDFQALINNNIDDNNTNEDVAFGCDFVSEKYKHTSESSSNSKSVDSYQNCFVDYNLDEKTSTQNPKQKENLENAKNGVKKHLESCLNRNTVTDVFQNDTLRSKDLLQFENDWIKKNKQREIQDKEYDDNMNLGNTSIQHELLQNNMSPLDSLVVKELSTSSRNVSKIGFPQEAQSVKPGYKKLGEIELKDKVVPSMEILKQVTLQKSSINHPPSNVINKNGNQNMITYSAGSFFEKFAFTPNVEGWMVLNEALRELRYDLEKKSSLAFLGFDPDKSAKENTNGELYLKFKLYYKPSLIYLLFFKVIHYGKIWNLISIWNLLVG